MRRVHLSFQGAVLRAVKLYSFILRVHLEGLTGHDVAFDWFFWVCIQGARKGEQLGGNSDD